jgi:hypothetical protein
MRVRVRAAGRNHTANQGSDPLSRARPHSLAEPMELVRESAMRVRELNDHLERSP